MALRQGPFDVLFAEHAGSIPVEYLRALASNESGLDPHSVNPRSNATGLFQITQVALDAYNARHGPQYKLADLVDPTLNTTVAVDHIGRILLLYDEHPALKPDWSSRRFVELLTFGWNAGHNGVAWLVGKLEASGIPPDRITIDTVSQLAGQVTRNPNLTSLARVAWAKLVTRQFFGDQISGGGRGGSALASIAAAGAFVIGMGALAVSMALAEKARR